MRAMSAVRARKAEAAEAGRYEIQVGWPARGKEGWITVPVRLDPPEFAAGMRALDFIIFEDGRAVEAYLVEPVDPRPVRTLSGLAQGELCGALVDGLDEGAVGRVLIVTEGDYEEDWAGIAGLAGRLVAGRVKLDAVVAGEGVSAQRLKVLSEIAGGRFFSAANRNEAERLSAQLQGSYGANYQIRYQGPGGALRVEICSAKGIGELAGAPGCEVRLAS
jgi:hypothetical protein